MALCSAQTNSSQTSSTLNFQLMFGTINNPSLSVQALKTHRAQTFIIAQFMRKKILPEALQMTTLAAM